MKADILPPQTLFGKIVRYEIPQFQRPYVWEQEDQWEPLWDDVRNAAEGYLDSGGGRPHFMGAVVLQQRPNPAAGVETRIVVDGQQRLTTIQLLLDAVQETLETRGDDLPAQRLSLLVENNQAFWGGDPDHAFKVWPTISDRPAFRHAMRNDLPSSEYEQSRIVQAHDFFKDQVASWLADFPEQRAARTAALEVAVTRLLELVVIDLEDSDDPHVIFETLNARGTPLLQSDLVKNLVLYQAGIGIDGDSAAASRLWSFDTDWWRTDIRQGRLMRQRLDVFLHYWMIARTRAPVAADEVFSKFGDYMQNTGQTVQEITADVNRVGKVYRALEDGGDDANIASFIRRWRETQAGVLTPVLLWLFSSEAPPDQIAKSLRALESYLVRRMICRMTQAGYNLLFIRLLDDLQRRGPAQAGDAIVEYLAGQTANASLWPNDTVIAEAFQTAPLYRLLTRGRLRMVLEGIEAELRTNRAESQSVPRNLTIEHIMPQVWRDHWPLPSGAVDPAADPTRAALTRDTLVHSAGNLTLVTQRLNSSISNGPWPSKRAELDQHSVLFLNKDLLDNAPDGWDETAIAARARRLCQAAIKVWPHANAI